MEVKVQKLLNVPRVCILAVLALSVPALPSVAAAQVPATNASGGQYLPAFPGGGGNVEEGDLTRSKDDRGKGGMKSVAGGDTGADGAQVSLLFPLVLAVSGLAALVVMALRPGHGPAGRAGLRRSHET